MSTGAASKGSKDFMEDIVFRNLVYWIALGSSFISETPQSCHGEQLRYLSRIKGQARLKINMFVFCVLFLPYVLRTNSLD